MSKKISGDKAAMRHVSISHGINVKENKNKLRKRNRSRNGGGTAGGGSVVAVR